MKKILLLFLLTCFKISYGQEINYEIKKTRIFRETYENTKLIKTFHTKDESVYTIRYYNHLEGQKRVKGYIVQHWDNELKSLAYNKYILDIGKKGIVSGGFLLEGKLHVIEYAKNKKDKTMDCYIHKPLPNKTGFERKKLFSVNKIISY